MGKITEGMKIKIKDKLLGMEKKEFSGRKRRIETIGRLR
jgi:hypothetical protein